MQNKFTMDEILVSNLKKEEKEFWNKIFTQIDTSEILPVDKDITVDGRQEYSRVEYNISNGCYKKLEGIANGSSTSLHLILTAAFSVFLNKYVGANKYLIHTPIYDLSDGQSINTVIPLLIQVNSDNSFKEHLLSIKEIFQTSYSYCNYPIDVLKSQIFEGIKTEKSDDQIEIGLILKNIQDEKSFGNNKPKILVTFREMDLQLTLSVEYRSDLYKKETIEKIITHFTFILTQLLERTDAKLSELNLISEQEYKKITKLCSGNTIEISGDLRIIELFNKNVIENEDRIFVQEQYNFFSSGFIDKEANKVANYLRSSIINTNNTVIGILLPNNHYSIISVLGALKTNCTYIPIDFDFPELRIRQIINDAQIELLITSKNLIKLVNRLQWDCKSLTRYLCIDSSVVEDESERELNKKMSQDLWKHVVESAKDRITMGGWFSSYTGKPFSKKEMDEFCNNVFRKLSPLLNNESDILEIGCGSGLTMYQFAQQVRSYWGTDFSSDVIEANEKVIRENKINNIELRHIGANDIDKIQKKFDLIILNSVIQCFHGHNYLKKVLKKAVKLIKNEGYIFIGDILDNDLKGIMINDLKEYKNATKSGITKVDWTEELFLSRNFINDLQADIPEISDVQFTPKIHAIENELTKYRFDAIISINKKHEKNKIITTSRFQNDNRELKNDSFITDNEIVNPQSNPLHIIYTSGTTGSAKGVVISESNMLNYIYWFNETFNITKQTKAVLTSSMAYDAVYTQLYSSILSGCEMHCISKDTLLSPEVFLSYIQNNHISYIKLTPSLLNVLVTSLSFTTQHLSSINFFLVGGEKIIPEDIKLAMHKCDRADFYNHYGPTETTIGSLYKKIERKEIDSFIKSPSIGNPVYNTSVRLLDKSMNPLPIGSIGELFITGMGVTLGYLNNVVQTAKSFVKQKGNDDTIMYRTGDLTLLDNEGNIHYIDRIDNQVKIRGYRIELDEIEREIKRHPGISDAVVVSFNSNENDVYLVAYFVTHLEYKTLLSKSELKAMVTEKLPGYCVPRFFEEIDKIPLTSHNKINKKLLPDPKSNMINVNNGPRNEVEKTLVTIWDEVLGANVTLNNIDLDFFDIGGHSLKATLLVNLIEKYLNIKISISDIFQYTTIRQQADKIQNVTSTKFVEIKPVEKKEYYIQSSAQQRLFFLQHFENIGTSYNSAYLFKLPENVNISNLEIAFNRLVKRHEILRTAFQLIDNNPVQVVKSIDHFRIEKKIIKEVSSPEELYQIANQFIKPFNLLAPPLIQASILKQTQSDFLILNMHHIICDGSSGRVLVEDLIKEYFNILLPVITKQYKDYAFWQQKSMKHMSDQKKYWLEQYEEGIPELNIPLDYRRESVFSYKGDRFLFVLPEEYSSEFKKLSSKINATVFMNLLSAFSVTLSKYTGQDDLVIGNSVSGRRHSDTQNMIGMFVNELPIRCRPFNEKRYIDYAEEIRVCCLNAYDNQDYQFSELVQNLSVKRDSGRNPLFDICVTYQNFELPDIEVQEGNFEYQEFQNNITKFDITLFVNEINGELRFCLEYSVSLFKRETIQRLAKHIIHVIKEVISNPYQRVGDIQILSSEEKQRILQTFNNTKIDFSKDKLLCNYLEYNSLSSPDSIAVCFSDEFLSYHELNKRSNQLCNYLIHTCHIDKGEVVGVLLDRSLELIITIFGIIKSGAVYLPLNSEEPEERIQYVINDTNLRVIISQKRNLRLLNRLQWDCKSLETYLCIDTDRIKDQIEEESNMLMEEKIWDDLSNISDDPIVAGGWLNSFTGQPFTNAEMEEYTCNVVEKLSPCITKETDVLEIGCSTGLTMYAVAPLVKTYLGTDMSHNVIKKNIDYVKATGISNISLKHLSAIEVHLLKQKFDIIILNSVIHNFIGHNYLVQVIRKCINCLKPNGIIFMGDIIDLDKKQQLVSELKQYESENKDKFYRTKTDYSKELFLSKEFFNDLRISCKEIKNVHFSEKVYSLSNELTNYRYDVLLKIDKSSRDNNQVLPKKNQHDLTFVNKYGFNSLKINQSPEEPVYMIYTSGTTGRPKGTIIKHNSLINRLLWMCKDIELSKDDIFIQKTNYTFDVSVWELFIWSFIGARVVMLPSNDEKDPQKVLECIEKNHVSISHFVPSMLSSFIDYLLKMKLTNQLGNIRKIISSGEVLSKELVNKINKLVVQRKIELYNLYGPTEATIDVTSYKCENKEYHTDIPIGKPIDNIQVLILNEANQLQPVGVPGELCIVGMNNSMGYLNNSGLTYEKFTTISLEGKNVEVYHTGDIAKWLSDGNISYLGRQDKQVKIRGCRIELEEIEFRIRDTGLVEEVSVVNMDDGNLKAFYIPDKGLNNKWLEFKQEASKTENAQISTLTLPNNLPIFHHDVIESKFMYGEIFDNKSYYKQGITLGDNACIVDIGANIGLCTLYFTMLCKNPVIYACEPIEPIFKILAANIEVYGENRVKALNYGIADKEQEVEMNFYPNASILSGIEEDNDDKLELLLDFINVQDENFNNEVREEDLKDILNHRLLSNKIKCKIKPLSTLIVEENIKEIDLLKIDAEGSELNVLHSIEYQHIPLIKQIVIEVHDKNSELGIIKKLLESWDFKVEVESDNSFKKTKVFMVYAIRNGYKMNGDTVNSDKLLDYVDWMPQAFENTLMRRLKSKLPDYMLPVHYQYVDDMPRLSSGKIDKKTLLEMSGRLNKLVQNEKITEQEKELLDILHKITEQKNIGVSDNLFEKGLHSLKLIALISEIYVQMKISIPLTKVYQNPTIKGISEIIAQEYFHDDIVINLNNNKSTKNFFLFPPGLGYSYGYKGLSEQIENSKVYGFNFIESEDRLLEYATIIESIQPEGPYILGGFSAPGRLLLELSELLESKGKIVSDLILIDCNLWDLKRNKSYDKLIQNRENEVIDKFVEKYGKGVIHLLEAADKKRLAYSEYYRVVKDDYKPVNCDIHLIHSQNKSLSDRKKHNNIWKKFTAAKFQYYNGAGEHEYMITPPGLEKNSQIINKILQKI